MEINLINWMYSFYFFVASIYYMPVTILGLGYKISVKQTICFLKMHRNK